MTLQLFEKNLIDLIKIPSEYGEEQEAIAFLVKKISPFFKIIKIPVNRGRFCLLALGGKKTEKLLVAHVDTVKGQLPVKFNDEYIFGRGSCDNKSSVIAMIEAGKKALNLNIDNFGMLFTIGEETNFDGAKSAINFFKNKGIKPRLVMIGEPTDSCIVTAQKGVLLLEIICKGIGAHSSIPGFTSANHELVRSLNSLLNLKLDNTLLNIGVISGGTAPNIIAEKASAAVLIRSRQKNIDKLFFKELSKHNCKTKIVFNFPPKFSKIKNHPFKEVNFFTEMFFFENSVVCGAGNIKDAHSQTEKVSRKQLAQIINTYLAFLKQLK